jgi:hypothetical protein
VSARVLHLPRELAAIVLEAAARSVSRTNAVASSRVRIPSDGWLAQTIHEGANLADDPTRQFLIDPELQFKLLRHLRGAPDARHRLLPFASQGPSVPSRTDADSAYEDDFIWLIAAGTPASGFKLGAWWFSQVEGFSVITVNGRGASRARDLIAGRLHPYNGLLPRPHRLAALDRRPLTAKNWVETPWGRHRHQRP